MAHVLTTLPSSKLDDSVFRIEGERATLLEVAAVYPDKPVVHAESFENDAFKTRLHSVIASGGASTRWDVPAGGELTGAAGNSNNLWEGHKWLSIKEALKL